MTMPRRLVALLHAGYWALYLLLLAIVLASLRGPLPASLRVGLLLVVPNVVAFYVAYGLLFPRLFARQRFGAALFWGAAAALAIAAATRALLWLLARDRLPSPVTPGSLAIGVVLIALLAAIHQTIAVVLRGFIGWVDDLALKQELARKTADVESALVRAKLDPHFLFNTLNNIDVLIARDPATASAYLLELSEILRFVLYQARAERIPLQDELRYVERYVALQRLRSAHPGFVTLEITGDASACSIAPMLLIPFIENAFKHSGGQRGEAAIAIRVAVEDARLVFECTNRQVRGANPTDGAGGLGNDLMRRRLALLYPSRHTLDIAERDGQYSVSMTVETA
jgi:two-component system, LytTR family, sensor kinase